MIAAQNYGSLEASSHLRRFDAGRDLKRVADLVEQCFADTLDADGRNYIRQMRSAAQNPFYTHFAGATAQRISGPLSGFVWEDDERLVGNLTLIPYYLQSKRAYLIANVAVDRLYRRRGIARHLTNKAIEYARQHEAEVVWLHVRQENEAALSLYRTLGFTERARRTTWLLDSNVASSSAIESLVRNYDPGYPQARITSRRREDWPAERAWLEDAYPKEVTWHLELRINKLAPGFWGGLYRFLVDMNINQWSARVSNRLLGVLVINTSYSYSDRLWLAASPEHENEAAYHLLSFCRQKLHLHASLSLDFPSGRAETGIQAAGFRPHQTLIWMCLPLG